MSLPRKVIVAVALLLFGAAAARADSQVHPLYQGARALAMGNAFTAVADDEEAIFINPAGLAGIKKFQAMPLNLVADTSTDIVSSIASAASEFKNISPTTLNYFMGKNMFIDSQVTSSVVMPGFGVSLLVDDQAAISMQNQAFPQMEIGYQNTNGVQGAYGTSLLRGRKKGNPDEDLRVGFAAKMLWRRGGYHDLDTQQILNINTTTIHELTGSYGFGYGGDVGMQYLHTLGKKAGRIQFGAAWTDIGDTSFNSGASPIRQNLSLGVAWRYELSLLKITTAYDYQNLNTEMDWRNKNHLGLEVALPFASVMAGLNQTYLTYGAAIDLWLFRILAESYADELSSGVGQNGERRYLVQAIVKIGL